MTCQFSLWRHLNPMVKCKLIKFRLIHLDLWIEAEFCYAEHHKAIKWFFLQSLILKIYQHSSIAIGSTSMYFTNYWWKWQKTNCSQIRQVSGHEIWKTTWNTKNNKSNNPLHLQMAGFIPYLILGNFSIFSFLSNYTYSCKNHHEYWWNILL